MFLESYADLDDARVELLMGMGRIREAAAVRAEHGDMLKAVEILSAPATYSVDHVRPTIEYLLTGLRRGFTLGIIPTSGTIASKLLLHGNRLNESTISAMTERESNEVSPSHPFNQQV